MRKTAKKCTVARAGISGQMIDGLKEAVAFEKVDRRGSRVRRVKITPRPYSDRSRGDGGEHGR